LHDWIQFRFLTTSVPSGYLALSSLSSGLSPSGDTELVIMKAAPVASVGSMAGSTAWLKKRNSSAKIIITSLPVPRSAY
jgi:hypothetical protein